MILYNSAYVNTFSSFVLVYLHTRVRAYIRLPELFASKLVVANNISLWPTSQFFLFFRGGGGGGCPLAEFHTREKYNSKIMFDLNISTANV